MPSISFGEILMILLIVIIFVKPEEMPRFMRGVAKTYRSLQRAFFRVRNVTQDALREVSSVGLEEEWRQGAKAAPTLLPPAASVAQTTAPPPAASGSGTSGTPPPVATSEAAKPAVAIKPPADGPVPRA